MGDVSTRVELIPGCRLGRFIFWRGFGGVVGFRPFFALLAAGGKVRVPPCLPTLLLVRIPWLLMCS